jgi:hypothetical protein
MRPGYVKAALLGIVVGTSMVLSIGANATSRPAKPGDAKRAQQAASAEMHERYRLCRKQSYARNPGGEYYNTEQRMREIEQCYLNGGRLM